MEDFEHIYVTKIGGLSESEASVEKSVSSQGSAGSRAVAGQEQQVAGKHRRSRSLDPSSTAEPSGRGSNSFGAPQITALESKDAELAQMEAVMSAKVAKLVSERTAKDGELKANRTLIVALSVSLIIIQA